MSDAFVALGLGLLTIGSLLYFWRREELASEKRLAARLLEIDHSHAITLDQIWERQKQYAAEEREWRKNHRRLQQSISVLERWFQEHG